LLPHCFTIITFTLIVYTIGPCHSMSTPYVVISDSEDEYPPTFIPYLSESDSDVDMDISSSILGSSVTPYDGFIPEDEHTIPAPTTEVSDDRVDPGFTPTPKEPMETDPSEDEEEEPEEDDFDTADSSETYTTPPTTVPALHPHYYLGHFVVRGGARTRATARKSVPIPHAAFYRRDYRDIHTTPTSTTPIPAPTTTATAPIFTTPTPTNIPTTPTVITTTTTTTPAPQQDPSSRYREWMHTTLQTWRQVEGVPNTFELGESSTTPALASVTSILVARLARQEREQMMLERDFGRYTSQNTANIRQSFATVSDDVMMTDRAVSTMRTRLSDAELDIAVLRSRVEMAERHTAEAMRRIAELEETIRRQSGTDKASTSHRPGHP
jgi:hypothetical protein